MKNQTKLSRKHPYIGLSAEPTIAFNNETQGAHGFLPTRLGNRLPSPPSLGSYSGQNIGWPVFDMHA